MTVIDSNRRTGAGVRYARTLKGMKLKDLAERIGRSSAYVSRIEHGIEPAKSGDLMAFAHVLDVPLEELRNPWMFSTFAIEGDGPDPDAATVAGASPRWANRQNDATQIAPVYALPVPA